MTHTVPTGSRRRRLAFTLVELLVVIGVIALLAGILLPLITRSIRQAGRVRVQSDLQAISIALNAYKDDFGDYPRPDAANTGAAVLGKALMGKYGDGFLPNGQPDTTDPITYTSVGYKPGDCVRYSGNPYLMIAEAPGGTTPSNTDYWTPFNPADGADGPGFRTRAGTGKVSGPYLSPGKITVQGTYFYDHMGGPILYFPTRPAKPLLTRAATGGGPEPYIDRSTQSFINADNNFQPFRRLPDENNASFDVRVLHRMRMMLGDINTNGYIDGDEKEIPLPFVLMSPGADGLFGPAGYDPPEVLPLTPDQVAENRTRVAKCDDVTNAP